MIVEGQENLKVFFAGAENKGHFEVYKNCGVKYSLYSAYGFIKTGLKKGDIPDYIIRNQRRVIQDSGLFTLMYGSHKIVSPKREIEEWYAKLVDFTNSLEKKPIVVEVDCQKITGVEHAWDLRERMKKDLPGVRQINVLHVDDGQKGMDRMIEFSDYIALALPISRCNRMKEYFVKASNYIKSKKPEIDIHLLGMTDLDVLSRLKFCTSADSTSHLSFVRYGYIGGKSIKNINIDRLNDKFLSKNKTSLCASLGVYHRLNDYRKRVGNQN